LTFITQPSMVGSKRTPHNLEKPRAAGRIEDCGRARAICQPGTALVSELGERPSQVVRRQALDADRTAVFRDGFHNVLGEQRPAGELPLVVQRAFSHCGKEEVVSIWTVLTAAATEAEPLPKLISGCDDLLPCLKSTLPFGSVVHGRKEMSFGPEMGSEYIVSLKKTLRMLRRLEARFIRRSRCRVG
jgi:hypothetical protein